MSVTSITVDDVLARFDAALGAFKDARKEIATLLKARKPRVKKEGDEPTSAWTAWTALVMTKYKDAYATHMATGPVNKKGTLLKVDPMGFASKCRKELFVDDWNEHERIWKLGHPKDEAKPEAKAKAKAESKPEPEPEPKPDAEPDELPKASPAPAAKPKAKAAPKKAAKPEPSAEAAAEAVEWKNRGKVYMKNPANQVWQVGEDGVGEYVGFFDGKAIQKGKLAA